MTFSIEATIAHCGGKLLKLKHNSSKTNTPMDVNVYLPPNYDSLSQSNSSDEIPVLLYLAGLTCTPQTGPEKSNLTYHASKNNMAIIFPDTSPRGANIDGEDVDWDFGSGAGFYLDATTEKWSKNYNMYSYILEELLPSINNQFPPLNVLNNCSITGHSMGGYGALMFYLRNPSRFKSVSAFAPIVNPSIVPWGEKCFSNYLGDDKNAWLKYDPCHLIKEYQGPTNEILIYVGDSDLFETRDGQLRCPNLVDAAVGTPMDGKINLNIVPGYDHSYYFISSFAEQVMQHHVKFAAN